MRITENLLARAVLNGSARALSRLAAAQQRLATGKNFTRPSDDPLALSKALSMRGELARIQAHGDNASGAVAFMSLTEGSLQEISDLLAHAKELVVAGMNDTNDEAGADAQALELRSMIESLLQLANRDSAGRRIFAGQSTTEPAYSGGAGSVVYRGDRGELIEELGRGLRVAINLTGPQAFETVSARLEGTVDLDPAISSITPLSDLDRGQGVMTGRIRITDSNGVAADLDLLSATTIGDVVRAINDAGTSIVASIDPDREAILLTDTGGGSTLSVEDLDGGTLAADLGIANVSDTASIEGRDLDPVLTENTPTALLFRGAGIAPGTWTLCVGSETGTLSAQIDPASANTVGDLLQMIEHATTANGTSLGLRAHLSADRITLESGKLHTTLSISDDAAPGSAQAMGLTGIASPRDVFALLEEAATAVSARDHEAMDRAIRDLTSAIEGTAGMRGSYGSRARQVLQLRDRLLDEDTNLTIRLADIEDADLAKESLELAQAQTVYNAALSVGARLYDQNLFDYIR